MKEAVLIIKMFLTIDEQTKKGFIASLVAIASAFVYKTKYALMTVLNIKNETFQHLVEATIKWVSAGASIVAFFLAIASLIHKIYEIKEHIHKARLRKKDN